MLNKVSRLFLVVAVVLNQSAAFAQTTGRETVQELFTLFSAWSSPQSQARIFTEAAQHIDYPTMAEMAFTPAQWDCFTPSEKKELIRSFRTLVENRYYERWHKLFLRSRLSIANEAKAGGDIYVKTYITEGKSEDTVIWRLRPKCGEPMVISMDVNGKDLVSRLSDRFQKQLKKRGPQGLIAWIKDKADMDDDDANGGTAAVDRKSASR